MQPVKAHAYGATLKLDALMAGFRKSARISVKIEYGYDRLYHRRTRNNDHTNRTYLYSDTV
jgi:hypothetical protein